MISPADLLSAVGLWHFLMSSTRTSLRRCEPGGWACIRVTDAAIRGLFNKRRRPSYWARALSSAIARVWCFDREVIYELATYLPLPGDQWKKEFLRISFPHESLGSATPV